MDTMTHDVALMHIPFGYRIWHDTQRRVHVWWAGRWETFQPGERIIINPMGQR